MSNRQSTSGSSSSTIWIVVAVVVVVGLAGVLAVALTSGQSDGSDNQAITCGEPVDQLLVQGDPTVTGASLSAMPEGGLDAAIGSPVPTVEGQQLCGEPLSIGDDGEPKVVVFLAHWCPHCRAEVPRVAEHFADGGPEGVAVYGVTTGTDATRPNYPPGAWLAEEGWPFPTMADSFESTVAQAFGLTGFPYFVAIDADGNLVSRTSGELTTEQFDELVEAARSGAGGEVDGGPSSDTEGNSDQG